MSKTPSPIAEPLRAAIRDSIENKDPGLNELCRRIGVQAAGVSRFLNHKRTITLETADAIADALGLELTPKQRKKR
jgi:plasmid maintenance system antidote protein VapI